jgi:hypothetical protein
MMKSFLVALACAFLAVVLYVSLIAVQALSGIGPFGSLSKLVSSGVDTPGFVDAWFAGASRFVQVNRWVMWPAALIVAAAAYGFWMRSRPLVGALIIALPAALAIGTLSRLVLVLGYCAYAIVVFCVVTAVTTLRRRPLPQNQEPMA